MKFDWSNIQSSMLNFSNVLCKMQAHAFSPVVTLSLRESQEVAISTPTEASAKIPAKEKCEATRSL